MKLQQMCIIDKILENTKEGRIPFSKLDFAAILQSPEVPPYK